MVLVMPTAASPARGGLSYQLVKKSSSPCAAFDIIPGPGYPNWGGLVVSASDLHVGKGKAHTYNQRVASRDTDTTATASTL